MKSIKSLTHLCIVLYLHIAEPEAITLIISNVHLQLLAFHVQDRHIDIEEFLNEYSIDDDGIILLPTELLVWGELGQEYHRCISPSKIQNVYANYLDIAKVPKLNQCTIMQRPRIYYTILPSLTE
ncbi:uncharacterized protein F5891DRAFT_976528 [Suillus fuscotomentosus]|uniref:Uncharacterized protein n=1 Tax=Suillus fuscotomentosus TaxID=1912939 RepID=A0AAD4EEU6_9AGAM|nr:uncharacterized protein F5891DRAFT_976528 [Suillus fuscotomentosus]KAG1904944.1 hypothetical protein F5891DRAFT_976528 [Suillus fuscotomentosus]